MNLTPDQLRQNAAAMIAHADGKPVQVANIDMDDWIHTSNPAWEFYDLKYRPKPEPVCRPWSKPDVIPLHCYIRKLGSMGWSQIVGASEDGVWVCGITGALIILWSQLGEHEWSTDLREWHPCVTEEQ